MPPKLPVVAVLPGKTLGGICLATYGAGSVLEYHELIVISALVRNGLRLGAWISHIYVDNAASVAGGREIWGLPKQRAEFTWNNPLGSAVVRQGERTLCTLSPTRRCSLGRLPTFIPAFSQRGTELVWFKGTGTAQLRLARGAFDVPSTSPFSTVGFGSGLGVHLHSLKLLVHAPKHLARH